MAVRYFRAIDGLGRIVLPAELLHHLNWENVCFDWRKGWLLNRFFRPGCRSNPRTARSDHRKSFLCRCLKNDKTASLFLLGKRFFAVFALLGVGHPRWGDFEKSALKSPETRMNTEKNRGDIYFVTPSWEGVTKLLSAGIISFGRNLLTQNKKEHSTKWEFRVQNRYIWLFLQPIFLFFAFWCLISIKRDKPRKMA